MLNRPLNTIPVSRLTAILAVLIIAPCLTANDVSAKLETGDVEALVKVARLVLSGQVRRIRDIPDGIVTPNLIARYNDQVSITLFADRAPLTRYTFRGKNLVDCAYGMMTRATAMPGHLFYGLDQSDDVGFLVEIVSAREPVKPENWRKRLSLLALGIEGIEIADTRKVKLASKIGKTPETKTQKRFGILLPARAVTDELDSRDRFIFRLCENIGLYPSRRTVMPSGSQLWDKETTQVQLIQTRDFLVLPKQTRARELFRLNTTPETPSAGNLLDMARAAGDQICQRQKHDGSFFSSFRASTTEESDAYGMINHGLAVQALLDLYQKTREKRYLDAAAKGLNFALDRTRLERKGQFVRRFVVFEEQARLGTSALTVGNLIRLAELAGNKRVGTHDVATTARHMAQFLLDMQYDDGSFRYSYRYDRLAPYHYQITPVHSDMAAWALLNLAPHSRAATYRDRAQLAAKFLITKREAHLNWKQPPAFTWLANILARIARQKNDADCAKYLFRMADHVVAEQYLPDSDKGPDVVGAYAANASSLVTATSCKMVVVGEAARLARHLKDPRAERYIQSLKLASAFLNTNRFRAENAFFVSDLEPAQGLFRAGLFRTTSTLDTNAFAIQACLILEQLLTDNAD